MRVAYRVVDAFTARPHAGVPVGVVTQTEDLVERDFPRLARAIGADETVFVFPSPRAGALFILRVFTRAGEEVEFSGAATVAAYHALHETALFPRVPVMRLDEDAANGERRLVEIRTRDDSSPSVHVVRERPKALDPACDDADVARALGLDVGALADSELVTIGSRLVVHVGAAADLATLSPARPALAALARSEAVAGIVAFAVENARGEEGAAADRARFLAVARGENVAERGVVRVRDVQAAESSTGSFPDVDVLAGLAHHLDRLALARADAIAFEVGDERGRPCTVLAEAVDPANVRLGGTAVTVAQGRVLAEPTERVRLRII